MNTIIQLFKNHSLITTIAIIDLKSRYRHSGLGILWSFLEPLFILTILNFVFSNILISQVENFPIFLILNLTLFNMFTRGTSMASESILSRSTIIKSTSVNREIFPIASVITAFLMMTIEFSIVILFLLIFQFVPFTSGLILLGLIPILFMLTLGVGLILSALNVFYRDIRIIWSVTTQGLFFLTPIIYKMDFLPDSIASIVKLNPLAQIIHHSHQAFMFNQLPNSTDIIFTFVVSTIILITGWILFKKLDRLIPEVA